MQKNIVSNSKTSVATSYILKTYGTLIGLTLLCIAFSLLSPVFATFGNAITILRQIAMLSIMGAGLTVVLITKRSDLSIGYVASFLGVVVAALIVNMGMPVWLAVIITLLTGAFIGFINGCAVAYIGIPDFIATLAIGFLISGLYQAYTHGHPISGLPKIFGIFGQFYLMGIPNAIYFMGGFLAIIYVLLSHTRIGRYVYAIGGNEEAAMMSGVNIKLNIIISYVICGIGVALTAIVLTSRLGSAHPLAGDGMLLDAIATVYLGGTAFKDGEPNLAGTFVGALIIGVLSNGLTLLNVPYYYQNIAKGLIILLAVSITSLNRVRKK